MNAVSAIPDVEQLPKLLNENVLSVIADDKLIGFEKAFRIAKATTRLRELLTTQYMEPIMALQGSRLGFKTDKDDSGGYPVHVVKDCLIEAVLSGVQPFGNQFNIIAGNCYITKEGMGQLLSKLSGLEYDIIPSLPRINGERTSSAIVMKISWTFNGKSEAREIDLPIRMNKAMGTDAVIGKATRKARAWLFSKLTGVEIGEGDVQDIDHKIVKEEITVEQLQELLDEKIALLNKPEFDNAKRIIEGNEVQSFKKLHTLLTSKI